MTTPMISNENKMPPIPLPSNVWSSFKLSPATFTASMTSSNPSAPSSSSSGSSSSACSASTHSNTNNNVVAASNASASTLHANSHTNTSSNRQQNSTSPPGPTSPSMLASATGIHGDAQNRNKRKLDDLLDGSTMNKRRKIESGDEMVNDEKQSKGTKHTHRNGNIITLGQPMDTSVGPQSSASAPGSSSNSNLGSGALPVPPSALPSGSSSSAATGTARSSQSINISTLGLPQTDSSKFVSILPPQQHNQATSQPRAANLDLSQLLTIMPNLPLSNAVDSNASTFLPIKASNPSPNNAATPSTTSNLNNLSIPNIVGIAGSNHTGNNSESQQNAVNHITPMDTNSQINNFLFNTVANHNSNSNNNNNSSNQAEQSSASHPFASQLNDEEIKATFKENMTVLLNTVPIQQLLQFIDSYGPSTLDLHDLSQIDKLLENEMHKREMRQSVIDELDDIVHQIKEQIAEHQRKIGTLQTIKSTYHRNQSLSHQGLQLQKQREREQKQREQREQQQQREQEQQKQPPQPTPPSPPANTNTSTSTNTNTKTSSSNNAMAISSTSLMPKDPPIPIPQFTNLPQFTLNPNAVSISNIEQQLQSSPSSEASSHASSSSSIPPITPTLAGSCSPVSPTVAVCKLPTMSESKETPNPIYDESTQSFKWEVDDILAACGKIQPRALMRQNQLNLLCNLMIKLAFTEKEEIELKKAAMLKREAMSNAQAHNNSANGTEHVNGNGSIGMNSMSNSGMNMHLMNHASMPNLQNMHLLNMNMQSVLDMKPNHSFSADAQLKVDPNICLSLNLKQAQHLNGFSRMIGAQDHGNSYSASSISIEAPRMNETAGFGAMPILESDKNNVSSSSSSSDEDIHHSNSMNHDDEEEDEEEEEEDVDVEDEDEDDDIHIQGTTDMELNHNHNHNHNHTNNQNNSDVAINDNGKEEEEEEQEEENEGENHSQDVDMK